MFIWIKKKNNPGFGVECEFNPIYLYLQYVYILSISSSDRKKRSSTSEK
jgi:hypothetical protein